MSLVKIVTFFIFSLPSKTFFLLSLLVSKVFSVLFEVKFLSFSPLSRSVSSPVFVSVFVPLFISSSEPPSVVVSFPVFVSAVLPVFLSARFSKVLMESDSLSGVTVAVTFVKYFPAFIFSIVPCGVSLYFVRLSNSFGTTFFVFSLPS